MKSRIILAADAAALFLAANAGQASAFHRHRCCQPCCEPAC